MDHEDRERKFEQALQRHLRRDSAGVRNEADSQAVPDEAGGAAECLDAATLAAFHEDTLSSSEMLAVKEHLANCSRCQKILIQLQATDEIPLPAEPQTVLTARESASSRQRPGLTAPAAAASSLRAPRDISRGRGFKALRWAPPAGAIAAGLLIWIVVRDNKVQPTHFENVQVAQQQSTEEQPATPRALPASPAPEPATKITQLNDKRKDDSTAKQTTKDSGALRAPKHSSSATITDEAVAVASGAGPRANAGQLQAKSRNFPSRETVENKPPEIGSRQADVSVTAAPAAAATAPLSANTRTIEPPSNENGGIELLQTQQGEVTDKLELRSLKRVGFDNANAILASNGTVRWRALSAGRIEQSVDSGITWVQQNSGVKVELLAGSAPSEAVCWIVGRSGTVLRTTDGGGHWNKVISPMHADIAEVQAVDAMTAEIFDAKKSSRFVTHDGGASWQTAKQ